MFLLLLGPMPVLHCKGKPLSLNDR